MGAVCSFMWERTGGMLPKPLKMSSSRIPVCMCQTKLWETDSTKAKNRLVRPVRSSEAQLVLQEHETGRSPAGIPSSEQMWWACCWVRHKMWKGMIALNCASFKKKINGIPTGKCIQLSSIGVKMRCVKWPQVRKVIWLKILVCTTML